MEAVVSGGLEPLAGSTVVVGAMCQDFGGRGAGQVIYDFTVPPTSAEGLALVGEVRCRAGRLDAVHDGRTTGDHVVAVFLTGRGMRDEENGYVGVPEAAALAVPS